MPFLHPLVVSIPLCQRLPKHSIIQHPQPLFFRQCQTHTKKKLSSNGSTFSSSQKFFIPFVVKKGLPGSYSEYVPVTVHREQSVKKEYQQDATI